MQSSFRVRNAVSEASQREAVKAAVNIADAATGRQQECVGNASDHGMRRIREAARRIFKRLPEARASRADFILSTANPEDATR